MSSGQPVQKRRRSPRAFAKSAATRRRILEAAASVLLEQGAAATRLGDIAERAGLQAGSLYYYFDSRDELIEEVLRYGVQWTHTHVATVLEGLPEDTSPGDRLGIAIRAHLEAMLQIGDLAPVHGRLYIQVSPDMQDRLRTLRRSYGAVWTDLINNAVASGDLRDDVEPYLIQSFIVNSLDYFPNWRLRTKLSAEEMSEILRSFFFEGISGRASGTLQSPGGDTAPAASP